MITGQRSKKDPSKLSSSLIDFSIIPSLLGNNQQAKTCQNQWSSYNNQQNVDNRYELTSAMQEAFRNRNIPLKGVSEHHLTPQISVCVFNIFLYDLLTSSYRSTTI